jgi:multidrug efflux system membrane fusion protein
LKRFLFVLVLVAVGVVFAAERIPWLRTTMPWLPHMPWMAARSTGADGESAEGAAGQGSGHGRRGGKGAGGANGPIPVLVAQARYADLPVTVDILGTVQATNTVTVRSQVDGKMIEVDFKEGQDVKKGDVLARVDPATFQAAYDQAVAKKAQDDSVLANAQVDLVRYAKLAETQYGSHQQADTQKALVAQNQAIVQQDQAAIDSARTTLDYATIRSPITGRTGLRLVDAGNIVHAADTTGIVTVAEVRPITVVFALPQQNLRQVNLAMAKGPLKVEALDGDNKTVLDTGVLEVVDNSVDQTTGTVKLKASFPNPALLLWPGQFVNVRLYIDMLTHVVVVPTSSVQRGPDGAFVYVVADGKTVAMRKVETGRQTESDSVVTGGLEPPAMVVTTGFTRLTDGAKVQVSSATASTGASDVPNGGGEAGTPGATPAATGSAQKAATDAEATPTETAKAPDDARPADGTTHRHHRRDGGASSGNGGQGTAGP